MWCFPEKKKALDFWEVTLNGGFEFVKNNIITLGKKAITFELHELLSLWYLLLRENSTSSTFC